jgi:hypothetical protein
MSLLDLTKDAAALEQLMLDAVDPETGEVLDQEGILDRWLAETEGNLSTKLENIARILREWQASAAARKAEEAQLAKGRKAIEARAERLKAWTKFCLESQDLRKVEAGPYTFAIQNNGGAVPMRLLIEDPENVPVQFLETKVTINTTAIRAALEAGDEVAATVAELGERGTSLRIK